jgi:hypothetical protein
MNEESSSVVIELAKEFIELVRLAEPKWTKAFYRFRSEGIRFGSNGSYVVDSNVMLISALKNARFYDNMNRKGARLLELLGKSQGVFLLTIDAEFNYDIKFEWVDLHRWEITKLNGRTGVPEGI